MNNTHLGALTCSVIDPRVLSKMAEIQVMCSKWAVISFLSWLYPNCVVVLKFTEIKPLKYQLTGYRTCIFFHSNTTPIWQQFLSNSTFFLCLKWYLKFGRNSPKLEQIIPLQAIWLSGKFQGNRIFGSQDKCLGINANHRFGDIFCVKDDISKLALINSPKLTQIIYPITIIAILYGNFQENQLNYCP